MPGMKLFCGPAWVDVRVDALKLGLGLGLGFGIGPGVRIRVRDRVRGQSGSRFALVLGRG